MRSHGSSATAWSRQRTITLATYSQFDLDMQITQCRKRHTAADVLAFFKTIDKSVPPSRDIHVVLDNLSAHKAPEITDWLAPRGACWHLHLTPTSNS